MLGKWLATGPKVLIFDSPTVGVDIGNKRGIYELIRQLAASGVGILLISDEIPEVYYHSDRVLHMRAGRILGDWIPAPSPSTRWRRRSMRELASRLAAHTEMLLLLVILLLGAILDVASPYFLTLSNIVDLIESYSVTAVLAAGRVRRAGGRRDRHLVRRHGLGSAIRRGLCRHRMGLPAPSASRSAWPWAWRSGA